MAPIAPVGDEVTGSAVFPSGAGGGAKVRQGVIMTTDERHPRRGAGTNVKGHAGFRKAPRLFADWMVRLVPPIQGDHVLGQFLQKLRMLDDDVAPKHHSAASSGHLAMDLPEEIHIDTTFASCLAKLFALAPAQVPGFVATDIKSLAGEIRQ